MLRNPPIPATGPRPPGISARAVVGLVLGAVLATMVCATATASPVASTPSQRTSAATGQPLAADTSTSPHFGPAQTVMAWSRSVEDFSAIRIVIARPRGPVQELTHSEDGVQDIDPKFSPDGARILFERDMPDGSVQLVVINVDGTGEQVLPLGCVDPCAADLAPTWAPDGQHVYFTRVMGPFNENGDAASALLYRATLDGTELTRISEPGIDGVYEDYSASFAPAGYMVFIRIGPGIKSAAFRRDHDGRTTQLTPYALDADMLSVSPASSGPSKDLIVFETYGHGGPDGVAQAVATVPATCSSVEQCAPKVRYLTSPDSLPDQHFNPSWSPDGKQIAYVRFSYVDPGPVTGDIWRMQWNGKNQRPVSTSPRFEFRPAWAGKPARNGR